MRKAPVVGRGPIIPRGPCGRPREGSGGTADRPLRPSRGKGEDLDRVVRDRDAIHRGLQVVDPAKPEAYLAGFAIKRAFDRPAGTEPASASI